jgi:hypothetical protein
MDFMKNKHSCGGPHQALPTKLPKHLRERWIMANPTNTIQDPTTPSSDLAMMSPVQYDDVRSLAYHSPNQYHSLHQYSYHPMMNYYVAPIYPSVLPYRRPQQHHHKPVMFNPTMYQS